MSDNPPMITVPDEFLSDRVRRTQPTAPSRELPIPVPQPVRRGIPIDVAVPAPGEPGSVFNPVVVTREEQQARRERAALEREQDAREAEASRSGRVFAPGELQRMMSGQPAPAHEAQAGPSSAEPQREEKPLSFDDQLRADRLPSEGEPSLMSTALSAGASQIAGGALTVSPPELGAIEQQSSSAKPTFDELLRGASDPQVSSAAEVYARHPELDPKNRKDQVGIDAAEFPTDFDR